MKWMCAFLLCVLCVGCDEAAKPGTDAWIVGKWNTRIVEGHNDDDPATMEFLANHSCRRTETESRGRQDIDDAAWKIVGNNLVIMPISGESEAGPDMEEVKERLAKYEEDPEKVLRKMVAKMEDLTQDSFTFFVEERGNTLKIKATRIKS